MVGLAVLVATSAILVPLLVGSSARTARAGPRTTAAPTTQHPRATVPNGTQLAELKGSDTTSAANFGGAVALFGATVVVGAPGDRGSAGRAYVVTKTARGWTQVAELKGSDTISGDWFGESVAISGKTIVVGASNAASRAGRAYVFSKTAAGWTQVAELKGSDTVANDRFGGSVAISGTTVVVGAMGHTGGGRAYVFTNAGTGWSQIAELKGSNTSGSDDFGGSVAISGTTLVVGDEGPAKLAGRAYVFTKTRTSWKQVAQLRGSDTVINDNFGTSVALSTSTVVVGAWQHAHGAGRAYVFTRTATGYKQTAELKGSDTVANDNFGISVSLSGTIVVVGAWRHLPAGRAYLFEA